ncbi:2-iminobutanoate/2-iminopropanoate deaminase-like [Biomphalaria glabrata]|uniref:2-iminobutanoate/2-iminopropanoate deaminase-like n=2 Tax=Biomphalaria TaxID=6525 RepID=A0A9W3AHE5_BIOGL|nr:2-iminobutanoate/2-iminopropanoate deaminase-like [Biomphalaria glabrata]KAK0068683.1 ribonuclease UK114 [Biomphalaria pfeifferi]
MASKTVRKIITAANAPTPRAPYSQGVQVNNTLYVSGQIGINPESKEIVQGGAVAEADQALKNIGAILEAASTSYDNVVKCTVLLQNINDFAAVNEVYAKYFPNVKPARAAYQVAALPLGANVEIEAIAIVGEIVDA